MPRPVQRGRRKTKTKTIVDKSNSASEDANQNVTTQTVKVVIQHPDPKKPAPRRKRAPKGPSKKDLAISKLKGALNLFNAVKAKADQAKVEIPAALGETPTEVNSVKTVADIDTLTETILQRVRSIEELIQKQESRPSFFGMPERVGNFASEFTVNRAVLPPSVAPVQPAGYTPAGLFPPQSVKDSAEDKLKKLEQSLVPKNPEDVREIEALEIKEKRSIQQAQTELKTEQQSLGMQLASGKITQKEFEAKNRSAIETYNAKLKALEVAETQAMTGLEKNLIGKGVEEKWKQILKHSNFLKLRIKGINDQGSATMREVEQLESNRIDDLNDLNALLASHRDSIEIHPDLFPGLTEVKRLFNTSVRSQITATITENRSKADLIDVSKQRLQEVNQMLLQLNEDIHQRALSQTEVASKLADIATFERNQIALNTKDGIDPNDTRLDTVKESITHQRELAGSVHPTPPRPKPPLANEDRDILQSYVNNMSPHKIWNESVWNAVKNLGWRGYYYRTPSMTSSTSINDMKNIKTARERRVELLVALLAGTPTPPNWFKEF